MGIRATARVKYTPYAFSHTGSKGDEGASRGGRPSLRPQLVRAATAPEPGRGAQLPFWQPYLHCTLLMTLSSVCVVVTSQPA